MRLRVAAILIAATGCRGLSEPEAAVHEVRVTFSVVSPQVSAPLDSPFVSVIDSVALTIEPLGAAPMVLWRHLNGRQTTVPFSFDVPSGTVRFEARVFSTNDSLLFEGSRTVTIDTDGMTIDLTLVAQSPVLAVSPDTIRLFGDTSFLVHNRGIDTLLFRIDSSPVFRTECRVRCFVISPTAGIVRNDSAFLVRLHSVQTFFQAPIELTVQSSMGSVVIVVRSQ